MKSDIPATGASAATIHAAALTFSVRKSSSPPIELARRTVRAFFQNLHRTSRDEDEIRVIVEEWLVNLVKHGCSEGRTHLASLTLINLGAAVRIRLEDDCAAFDPTMMPLDVAAEPQNTGKLGVQLIRASVEQFDYERHAEKNIWVLIRQIASPNPQPGGVEDSRDGLIAKTGAKNGAKFALTPMSRRDQES
jgi:serine/threonine-protein kinase RsbW